MSWSQRVNSCREQSHWKGLLWISRPLRDPGKTTSPPSWVRELSSSLSHSRESRPRKASSLEHGLLCLCNDPSSKYKCFIVEARSQMLPFFSFPVMNQAGRDKNWEEENLSLNLSYISRYEAHTQRTSSVSISSVLLSTCLSVLARSCEVPDDQISKYSKVSQKKLNCENTSRGFMLVFSDKARGKHEMRSYSERDHVM